jgi:hypothetical protein
MAAIKRTRALTLMRLLAKANPVPLGLSLLLTEGKYASTPSD